MKMKTKIKIAIWNFDILEQFYYYVRHAREGHNIVVKQVALILQNQVYMSVIVVVISIDTLKVSYQCLI